jgi:hypothetical protein
METRNISINVDVINGPHGADVAGSLSRIAECVNLIVSERPIIRAKLLSLLVRSEIEINGITMPEIEYAAYLAGMAERTR